MDGDRSFSWNLCAETDLVSENQLPGRSSFEGGVKFMVAESADRETLSEQPEFVRQTGVGFTLSPEEYQIITLIISGYTNQAMARRLGCSEATLHRRTLRIIEKLGVANKLELVLFALSHRFVNWCAHDSN